MNRTQDALELTPGRHCSTCKKRSTCPKAQVSGTGVPPVFKRVEFFTPAWVFWVVRVMSILSRFGWVRAATAGQFFARFSWYRVLPNGRWHRFHVPPREAFADASNH